VATRLGDFVLDGEARSLTRGVVPVRLTPKALDVLLLLVAERPRVVSKTELLDRVWAGTFVTDASLARTVHEIRDALGDAAATVRTVHGHGYAFQAEATDVDAGTSDAGRPRGGRAALAWLLTGSSAIPLAEGEALAGRDPSVAVPLQSSLASWHHARIVVAESAATIEDLGSKNGTEVCGERLTSCRDLGDGDSIAIGGIRLVFRAGEKPRETETAEN
jgi:DNA-binding winged helix-turn-helix (wHTH) protein